MKSTRDMAMISRKYTFTFSLLIILGACIYFGFRNRKTTEEANNPRESKENIPQMVSGESPSNDMDSTNIKSDSRAMAAPSLTREQKLQLAPNSMNVPIHFYGCVLDQDGNPLPGVHVVVSVRRWNYVAGPGVDALYPKSELTSDTSGRFQFNNGSGDAISIESLEKKGYQPEPKALRTFGYTSSDPIRPDQNHPVVFRMWNSEAKAAQLISGNKRFSLVPDGRVYTVDLLRGALADSATAPGDLRVSVRRPDNSAWGQHYDWTLNVQPVEGGLLEEPDETSAMFRAPTVGYTNQWHVKTSATNEFWSDSSGKKRFYLKSLGGQHWARVEIEVYAYYLQDKQARLNIDYALNPTGSLLLR